MLRASKAFMIVLCMVVTPPAYGLDRANLLFYLPFENSLRPAIAQADTEIRQADFVFPFKGSFSGSDAAVTRGKADDAGKVTGRATFVPGRRGLGLKAIDNPARSKVYSYPVVQYLARDSLARNEGTIAVWMKPVGWSRNRNNHRYFMAVTADNCTIRLYAYGHKTYAWVDGQDRYVLIGGSEWAGWKDDTWAFMTFTFKPGRQSFYLNGRLMNTMTEGLIEPQFGTTGVVEISEGSQVLDEMMIFNRALTSREVGAVYRANAP
ncbi:MAG: hypothetical protein CMJ18_23505 [Phycisphaeraceae bacterium]|nr:hypothetical protein [Phycisphaeraceae bacterium]